MELNTKESLLMVYAQVWKLHVSNEEVEQNHNSQLDCKIGSSPTSDSSENGKCSSKSQ